MIERSRLLLRLPNHFCRLLVLDSDTVSRSCACSFISNVPFALSEKSVRDSLHSLVFHGAGSSCIQVKLPGARRAN